MGKARRKRIGIRKGPKTFPLSPHGPNLFARGQDIYGYRARAKSIAFDLDNLAKLFGWTLSDAGATVERRILWKKRQRILHDVDSQRCITICNDEARGKITHLFFKESGGAFFVSYDKETQIMQRSIMYRSTAVAKEYWPRRVIWVETVVPEDDENSSP